MQSSLLVCSRCGARIATVRDTRFGLAPEGALCIACGSPAWRRLGAGVKLPLGVGAGDDRLAAAEDGSRRC